MKSIIAFCTPTVGIVGLILMIITRIKYPQNRFGKVVMWLYIITIIITVIGIIFAAVACFSFTHIIINSCQNCNG